MIRRTFGLFGLLVVGALVALHAAPAGAAETSVTATGATSLTTAAAAPKATRATYVYTVLSATCPAPNKAALRLRQRENGTSGTNYFKQIAQGQVFRGGSWQNRGNASVSRSTQFPNDARNFIFNGPNFVFTWNTEFAFSHRILVRLQWLNNAGTPNNVGDDFAVAHAAVFNRCT